LVELGQCDDYGRREATALTKGNIMDMQISGLTEEQQLMLNTCRSYVDSAVIPFLRQNWQREWLMDPDARLPVEILEGADAAGLRTLAAPEAYGGTELDRRPLR
jgi:alkylation response protein AidB-like acyl-CoA dehydrogenase